MTDRDTGDDTGLAPLVFFEYDHRPGTFCLLLSDAAMVAVEDVFERCGQYGNGYGWAGVARSAVRARAPELAGRFGYDPEAGMFVAYGEDADALRRLGMLLREALHDRAVLRELIESGDPEWFD
ncbi:immunity 51 family protein [Streptomyces sp. NBC_01803]|uniref:immunity 51 family protein n=1 Tax=Streptomyces sp. NBC_01803 TaxID=2975946 RepID=UPI002DDBA160|nr:immunity 51 family protein [Streptomyces sp. NBC_01803]WSA43388.1 immunity 51 family protein [Streptomyces sp. NBC_01803]